MGRGREEGGRGRISMVRGEPFGWGEESKTLAGDAHNDQYTF